MRRRGPARGRRRPEGWGLAQFPRAFAAEVGPGGARGRRPTFHRTRRATLGGPAGALPRSRRNDDRLAAPPADATATRRGRNDEARRPADAVEHQLAGRRPGGGERNDRHVARQAGVAVDDPGRAHHDRVAVRQVATAAQPDPVHERAGPAAGVLHERRRALRLDPGVQAGDRRLRDDEVHAAGAADEHPPAQGPGPPPPAVFDHQTGHAAIPCSRPQPGRPGAAGGPAPVHARARSWKLKQVAPTWTWSPSRSRARVTGRPLTSVPAPARRSSTSNPPGTA